MAFVHEADLVEAFGAAIESFPVGSLSPGAQHLLIIANDLSLAGAGSGGTNGSADIIAVDDQGELWVIEAKLASSSEINPSYILGNQLARYGSALLRTTLPRLHAHFQEYALSRRWLRPPAGVAVAWLEARSLRDMLVSWLATKDLPAQQADTILARLAYRMRHGQFVLAVLTDRPSYDLVRWSRDQKNLFQTSVISVSAAGAIEVLTRTPHVAVEPTMPFGQPLPSFDSIPQSFKPTPATLPRLLNENAFKLYTDVVLPRLHRMVGVAGIATVEQSRTSFGYCLVGTNRLPVVVRIGRGDERTDRGSPTGEPGQHTLKVDFVFEWACDAMLPGRFRGADIQRRVDELWDLTSGLVLHAGYRYKSMKAPAAGASLAAEFAKSCSARTLLVERAVWNGTRDFGCESARIEDQLADLTRAFDLLEDFLGGAGAARVVRRPIRIPYGQGPLVGCIPTAYAGSAGQPMLSVAAGTGSRQSEIGSWELLGEARFVPVSDSGYRRRRTDWQRRARL